MTPDPLPAAPEAVLFDMDGTLLDSEKVWDVALADLAAWLGGTLSPQARASMVGSSMARSIRILHEDVGVDPDPARSARFLRDRAAELFATDLRWRPGARELLDGVRRARVAAGLVTSTERRLTELALGSLGRHRFGAVVCGDEVEQPKPAPEPYQRAAALLGVRPERCVAIEDSPLGVAAAAAAGCTVVAVPSEVELTPAERVTVVRTLLDLTVADLAGFLASGGRGERSA